MKVLLTGKPGIGKTTALLKFIEDSKRKTAGIYTEAIKDENDLRVGFAAVRLDGTRRTLAHKQQFLDSPYTVGGKSGGTFFVDVDAISSFIVPALRSASEDTNAVTIVDEIGKIQACHPTFLPFVDELFASNRDILGTIVFDPEPWAEKFKTHQDTVLVTITPENRDMLPRALDVIFSNVHKTRVLNKGTTGKVNELTKTYLNNGQIIQIEKLYNNALDYIHEPLDRVESKEVGVEQFKIEGKHDTRFVSYRTTTEAFSCTCPLNRGEEQYAGQAGECSHIQAVKLLNYGKE